MQKKLYVARVMLSGRSVHDVKVSAETLPQARTLLEEEYGAGTIVQGPSEER